MKSKHRFFKGRVQYVRLTLAYSDADSNFLAYFVQRQRKIFLVLVVCVCMEKVLNEGECELNYQRHRGHRGLSLWTFDNSIATNYM